MTDELLTRIAEDLVGRVSGPMKFRLVLQPLMAISFAVKAGLKYCAWPQAGILLGDLY